MSNIYEPRRSETAYGEHSRTNATAREESEGSVGGRLMLARCLVAAGLTVEGVTQIFADRWEGGLKQARGSHRKKSLGT